MSNPPLIRLFHKFFLSLWGIAACLFLIEIVMRLAGFLFLASQEYANRASIDQAGEYRILCLGESTTALGGKNSYPRQLEEILNSREDLDFDISVINGGLASIASDGILASVEKQINQYRPDLVLVMMGINDVIYRDTGLVENEEPSNWLHKAAQELKIYKLAKLLVLSIEKKISQKKTFVSKKSPPRVRYYGAACRFFDDVVNAQAEEFSYIRQAVQWAGEGKLKDAMSLFDTALQINPRNEWPYLEMGLIYHYDDFEKAESAYKKAISINPLNAEAYHRLGHLYLGHNNQPKALFAKAVEIAPDRICSYMELVDLYRPDDDALEKLEKLYQRAIQSAPVDDWGYAGLAILYEEQKKYDLAEKYYQLADELRLKANQDHLRGNFLKLKDMLKQEKIGLIAVSYPMRSAADLKNIFTGDDDVLFVDNQAVFHDAVRKEGYEVYFSDRFAGDFGHCTAKGHRLLAQNIIPVIIEYIKRGPSLKKDQ